MDNHFIKYSLLLVWLHCSLSSTIGTYTTNCTSTEREALLAFKQGLSDPSARFSSWVGENCCEWRGVTCDFISGQVTKIDLRNSLGFSILRSRPWRDHKVVLQEYKKPCLGGNINPSLVKLKYLKYLDLSLNNFEGAPIPYFFGMLKNLRYLNLSSANFGGEIPFHLGNLSRLNYLNLSRMYYWYIISIYNEGETNGEGITIAKLHVENFQWLSHLSSLEYLNIGGLNLSVAQANLMHAVNHLSSLSELHLSSCDISSFDFRNLTSLKVLDLSFNYINSPLPLWLSNITTLTKLDLSGNGFQGPIPQDFVKLKNLQYFYAMGNELGNNGDHIPSLLGNLCKLQFLNLAWNNFDGKLDEFLGSFSNCSHNNLETLDLSANILWGSLPNSIGNFSLLQQLFVGDNNFNGTIPPNFGQLSELIQFEGESNSWEGVLTETHFMNLTKLEVLRIVSNKKQALVFNMSYDWIPPFRLKELDLENCLIDPQFPLWLQVQTQLIHVGLSNTGIFGFKPNGWISNVSSQITSLDLSNNLLNGKLPHLLSSYDLIRLKYPNLNELYLRNSSLFGPIPSNIGDLMPNLVELFLSENHVNGTIPPSVQKMRYLEVLSLSNNQLSGELFDDWGKLRELSVIDLANNYLYGKIPSSIGLLTYLNKLILSNNHLRGEIPRSLQSCSFLDTIDLSKNRLYGSLPSWMGVDLLNLQLLNLHSNLLSGTIPRQWCNLSLLRVLDLSKNNLSGEIPSCLYNWTTFVYGNYSADLEFRLREGNVYTTYTVKTVLAMKGREFEYNTTLKYVLTIDLSRNALSGEIPNEITKLIHLGTLNLSNNDLVGTIPENIGAMQQLETLDLSKNHLSGRIPASLASLNFLAHLDMSFNNLTGRIPTGNQLQTLNDPSIYESNPSLCGAPLQTKCSSDDHDSTTSIPVISTTTEEDGEEDDSAQLLDLYVGMTIGFAVGLNILFFTIFTSESRRISYFRFIDQLSNSIMEKLGFA